MKPREFVAIVPSSALIDPAEFLLFMASRAHELLLEDGQRLNDLTDFTTCLLEISRALQGWNNGPSRPIAVDRTCPRCGHVHEGDNSKECGFDIGGGRRCRCEMEVPV